MNNNTRTGAIVIVVIAAIVVILLAVKYSPKTTTPPVSQNQPTNTVTYACNAGKTITAAYYAGVTKPSTTPDQPPIPGGSVALTLSDGRTMTLPQTISADGTRYSNTDDSFTFWSKGNGAIVLENNQPADYIGCVMVAPAPTDGSLSQVYANGTAGFSLRYPTGYTVDESYKYQALGPGKDISGTKFTIPASLAAGTDLGPDSYVSVEEIPGATTCSASLFVSPGATVKTVTDNTTDYSVATSGDAAAGNRYDETVYAIPGTNPCVAVRYFIHYGAIQNYPTGAVKEFDEQALVSSFDQIRRTLVVSQ